MKIPKPSTADKDYFYDIAPQGAGIEVKPMFGNLGAFVNGNMFMGLFGADIGVRLDEPSRAELLTHDGTGRFGPEGRPMKEYVAFPHAWRNEPALTSTWVNRALRYVAAMPPKNK